MAQTKKVLRILFGLAFAGALAYYPVQAVVSWWKGRIFEKKMMSACRASVVGYNAGFPPSLRVEFVNETGRTLSPTHIRLGFYFHDRQISRLDKDWSFETGKQSLILQSIAAGDGTSSPPPPGSSVRYDLVIYPLYKGPLPAIKGEIVLRNP